MVILFSCGSQNDRTVMISTFPVSILYSTGQDMLPRIIQGDEMSLWLSAVNLIIANLTSSPPLHFVGLHRAMKQTPNISPQKKSHLPSTDNPQAD
jgi:hypothetical protein